MRCLTPFTNYNIPIFRGNERVVQDVGGYATYITEGETILAQFSQSGVMPHEVDEALRRFNFSGLPEGVAPQTRIGVFDTEAFCLERWPDGDKKREEMLIQVDAKMRAHQKKFPSHFIIMEEPKAPQPWGSYDKDTVEDILKLQERLEIDPTLVRRYEEENQKRESIMKPMLELEEAKAPEEREIEVSV